MKQRAVAIVADYLSKRPKGRIVQVHEERPGDYLVAIEDVRDGRTHVIENAEELKTWLQSFRDGNCNPATYGICGLCNRTHSDRGLDLEVTAHCLRCTVELLEIGTDIRRRE